MGNKRQLRNNTVEPGHDLETTATIERGATLFQGGRIEASLKVALGILEQLPRHAGAHQLAGLCYSRASLHDQALEHFKSALAIEPRSADYQINVAVTQLTLGQTDAAIKTLEKATRQHAGRGDFQATLADALRQQGRMKEAEYRYGKAVALNHANSETIANLVSVKIALGKTGGAEQLLERALKQKPADPLLLNALAILLTELKRFPEAETLLREVIGLAPGFIQARTNLIGVLELLQQRPEAIIEASALLELDPAQHGAARHLMRLLRLERRFEDAEAIACSYVEAYPDETETIFQHAMALTALGRLDAAAEQFRAVIHLVSGHAAAWNELSRIGADLDGQALDQAIKLTGQHQQSGEQRTALSRLHFARARQRERAADYDAAYADYKTANDILRPHYDEDAVEDEFRRLGTGLDADWVQHHARNNNESTPIFIIGMPRSGTTLVEQILGAHSGVDALGELEFMDSIVARTVENETSAQPLQSVEWDDAQLDAAAREYLNLVRPMPGDGQRFTDKMPQNFRYLGLLAAMFPKARFIHCQRDPMDTCLSIYFQDFSDTHAYAFDLHSLGHYYRQYQALMGHWQSILPGRIHELRYETLVGDFESQVRGLLDHCGLPFEDQCLAFDTSKAGVNTASVSQVRRPIYKSSVQRWRRFESQLAPLAQALEQG